MGKWPSAWALGVALSWGCQAVPVPGAPCERQGDCTSPLACRFGRCRTECDVNRDCPIGAQCFLDATGAGACQLEQDRSCGGGCPAGLSCLNEQCVRACGDAADCPSDGLCAIPTGASVGLCVDLRSDAGMPDGGLDAGPDDASTDTGTGNADVGLDANVDGGALALGDATVCAGTWITCAIRAADGAVFCAGDASTAMQSRIGDGHVGTDPTYDDCVTGGFRGPCAATPRQVRAHAAGASDSMPLVGATEVVCSDGVVCALVSGTVWCWGTNFASQRATSDPTPLSYATSTGIQAEHIYAGRNHACALDAGVLTCWGDGRRGATAEVAALGTLPHEVARGVLQVALGGEVTCWATDAASVSCVGSNASAQLGTAPATMDELSTVPVPIAVDGSRGLAAGVDAVCALGGDGRVRCWGEGERGMLGGGTVVSLQPMPAPVAGAGVYEAVFGGARSADFCARRATGEMDCWGDNNYGSLLVDPAVTSLFVLDEPTLTPALESASYVAFGDGNGVARRADGSVISFGSNVLGQLGQGDWNAENHPVPTIFPM